MRSCDNSVLWFTFCALYDVSCSAGLLHKTCAGAPTQPISFVIAAQQAAVWQVLLVSSSFFSSISMQLPTQPPNSRTLFSLFNLRSGLPTQEIIFLSGLPTRGPWVWRCNAPTKTRGTTGRFATVQGKNRGSLNTDFLCVATAINLLWKWPFSDTDTAHRGRDTPERWA